MIKKIFKSIKKRGIIGSIINEMRKSLGIITLEQEKYRQQEEIDALYHFISNHIDASSIPPTDDPDLRIMQKCDALLLQILDKICKKHHLTYWLDFGTLLGAVRHHGFIPWDDDTDVSMLREDYDKLCDILHTELDGLGFNIDDSQRMARIGFGYRHEQTGIWCDIFPVDTYRSSESEEQAVQSVRQKAVQWKEYYHINSKASPLEQLAQQKEQIMGSQPEGTTTILYHGYEFGHATRVACSENTILPLTFVEFEGYSFPAPNSLSYYMILEYGKSYMKIPRKGLLHHDEGRGALSTWAKRNAVDMNIMYRELTKVLDSLH